MHWYVQCKAFLCFVHRSKTHCVSAGILYFSSLNFAHLPDSEAVEADLALVTLFEGDAIDFVTLAATACMAPAMNHLLLGPAMMFAFVGQRISMALRSVTSPCTN